MCVCVRVCVCVRGYAHTDVGIHHAAHQMRIVAIVTAACYSIVWLLLCTFPLFQRVIGGGGGDIYSNFLQWRINDCYFY